MNCSASTITNRPHRARRTQQRHGIEGENGQHRGGRGDTTKEAGTAQGEDARKNQVAARQPRGQQGQQSPVLLAKQQGRADQGGEGEGKKGDVIDEIQGIALPVAPERLQQRRERVGGLRRGGRLAGQGQGRIRAMRASGAFGAGAACLPGGRRFRAGTGGTGPRWVPHTYIKSRCFRYHRNRRP